MATTVGTHDAKTRLSEYLNRVAYRGERILVERHGKPVAALVSVDDLRRLEEMDRPASDDKESAEREARFRQRLKEAGIIVRWPTGNPVELSERHPITLDGPPLSEQIVADRR